MAITRVFRSDQDYLLHRIAMNANEARAVDHMAPSMLRRLVLYAAQSLHNPSNQPHCRFCGEVFCSCERLPPDSEVATR